MSIAIRKLNNFEYGGMSHDQVIFLCTNDGSPIPSASFFLLDLAVNKMQAKQTLAVKASQLRLFLSWLNRMKISYRDINNEVMGKYLNGCLLIELGYSPQTVAIHSNVLKDFYSYCFEQEFVKSIGLNYNFNRSYRSMLREKSYNEKALIIQKLYMTEKVLGELVANTLAKNPFIQQRNRLMLYVGYHLGVRTSELTHPDNFSIKMLRETIPNVNNNFSNKLPVQENFSYATKKTRKKVNNFLTADLIRKIHDFIYDPRWENSFKTNIFCHSNGDLLTDDRTGSKVFNTARQQLLSSTDALTKSKRVIWSNRSYQLLRKCYATNAVALCRKNGDPVDILVKDWLGHSDFRTSLKHYIMADYLMNHDSAYLEQLKGRSHR
ncbi:hypothetical protein ACVBIO_04675 [Shewanella sp. 0m-8]